MKLIQNLGNDRVIDELNNCLADNSRLDLATSTFSLIAFGEMRKLLDRLKDCRIVLPGYNGADLSLLGTEADRAFRNRLVVPWLARKCSDWITQKANIREVPAPLPQCMMLAQSPQPAGNRVIAGNCPFSTEGLGITAGNQFSLVQASEQENECSMFGSWFTSLWNSANADGAKERLLERFQSLAEPKSPAITYYSILHHLFKDLGQELDEERIVKSATGIESIESTCRTAQRQFNRWLALEDHERTSARLMEMLGFDYFTLLDLLTIARSRKHVEKYYGTSETGKFPDRLKPINIKPDVDSAGQFRSIKEINVANKRFSQNEVGQTVLDAGVTECVLGDHLETPKLLKSLGLSSQPRSNLFALYQGWLACLEAYRAAQITGQFVLASDSASRDARHNALSEYARLERDIATLRSQAEREKQVNRRVELNMQIVDLSKQSDKSRESL